MDAGEDGFAFFHCFLWRRILAKVQCSKWLSLTPHKQVQNGHQHENFSISILP